MPRGPRETWDTRAYGYSNGLNRLREMMCR
jgi:hypothetical protein